MKDDENPCLIYDAEDGPDPSQCSHLPIVMIHDGGGTCFAYYCLNPIGRPMYEIHNPHFYSGKSWPGGIPEMARHYVDLMRQMVPRGRILLGGWSLGGLLSLEMARILADDPLYTVVGIVMVDSISPLAFKPKAGVANVRAVPYKQKFGPNTKQETIEGVERCFAEARKAVETYEPPTWDNTGRENEDGPVNGTNGTENEEGHTPLAKIECPPAILLRAKETVPAEPEEVSLVDVTRQERTLGWDKYREGFFKDILDIPGHHFNIFAWEHIDMVSERLMEACVTLEKMATKAPSYR
ncbi:Polyketide synthase PksR [Cytospora mali]|uniref:Polyketide synthase PksR n=1 Tax=Cytospora mali TaxID=578113 RepID=A0A194W5G1_CYTMA|nr:Polyketide synthase PksR [Valsa mali]